MSLQKINPALYIRNVNPVNEAAINVSGWYQTEYTTTEDHDSIPFMIAQGWVVTRHQSVTYKDGTITHYYSLSRRVLMTEKILQTLISSQIAAYNEGRQLNDMRYDDIVTLYTLMLDKTEDELNSLHADDSVYDNLITDIIDGINSDFDEYKLSVDALMDGFGVSELLRINIRFDARLAEARQQLIDRGMNNSTILDSIFAGIERERAFAITDLNDKINERQLSVEDRKLKAMMDVKLAILNARDRLRIQLSKSGEVHVEMRNRVLDALLQFMERRTDSYPDLTAQAKTASDLGAGSSSYPAP